MPMSEISTQRPEGATIVEIQRTIEEIARDGAQRILQRALEVEVAEHLKRYGGHRR